MSKLEQGILLDTHTWIWLFNGASELSQEVIIQNYIYSRSVGYPKGLAPRRAERNRKILSYGAQKYVDCSQV